MFSLYIYLSLIKSCFPLQRNWNLKHEDIDFINSPLKNVIEWNNRLLSVKGDIQIELDTLTLINTKERIYFMELTRISKQLHYLLVENNDVWTSLVLEGNGLNYKFIKKYEYFVGELVQVCFDFEKLAGRISLAFVDEKILAYKMSLEGIFKVINPGKHLENDVKIISEILKNNKRVQLKVSY